MHTYTYFKFKGNQVSLDKTEKVEIEYSHVLHNDILVNDGP